MSANVLYVHRGSGGYYNDKLFGAVTEYQYTYRNTNTDEICFYLPNVS